MTRQKRIAICLCAALVSVSNLRGVSARADDGNRDADKPIHLYAVSSFGPIGTVESAREFTINGRTLSGRQTIWGSELLRAPADMTARVIVDDVSRVTLKNDTIAKFSTSRATLDDGKSRPILIASLTSGEIDVTLDKGACAYVEAAGSAVTASRGADFRVAIREGKVAVDPASGEVEVSSIMSQNAAAKITHGVLDADPAGGYAFKEIPPQIDVIARETRNVQMRVTDQNDKPIPDIPVIFAVSSKSLGVFPGGASTVTATTNAQGVATAPFTAGPSSATGTINATVEGTNVSQTIKVNVRSRMPGKKLLAGAAVGLVVGIIIIVHPESGPLVQESPTRIP